MRIGATYSQNTSPTHAMERGGASKDAGATGTTGGAASSGGAGAVNVTLSAKARELDEARSPEGTEKVARLRASVESGTLTIDPQKIADAIVGE